MAATPIETAARAAYEEDKKLLAKSMEQYHERMKGKPVPSQEEGDLAKLGIQTKHKRASGAGPEPVFGTTTRAMSAQQPGGATYATRRTTITSSPNPEPSK